MFSCRPVATNKYNSFELQLFALKLYEPLLVALIYRPPKHNKDFLMDFADLLGDVIPKYEQLLILGDFNVHVCCAADCLAKEFINLLNAFDLTLQVNVPTHQQGHTLDLVLTYGFSLCDLEDCENCLFCLCFHRCLMYLSHLLLLVGLGLLPQLPKKPFP